MNVTSGVRTITEYQITLSEADAAECLSSPYEFAERVGEQLRAAGATSNNATDAPKHKPGKASQFTINPHKAKAGSPKAPPPGCAHIARRNSRRRVSWAGIC